MFLRSIVSVKLDQNAIKNKINKALGNSVAVKRLAYNKAFGVFRTAQRIMLQEFDRNIITQELLAGPRGVNMSDTLDGYGNLFSFIGFYAGDRPTERLRILLEMGTTFQQTVYRNGAWYFRVFLPNREAIENVTQMPWEEGNSWAYAVESEISGLSHYMYKRWGGSRSGTGFQLPYENWEGLTFKGRPYITEILNSFRNRVNKLG